MDLSYLGYIVCACCALPQPPATDRTTGITARVCGDCTHHQGDQDRKRVQRAESHERLIRKRLEACRASESQARRDLRAAMSDVKVARQSTGAALASRSRLAARIVEAALESPRRASELARDPDVARWARQVRQPEEYADF